jgi:putative ABC transport system ATP-binding protein
MTEPLLSLRRVTKTFGEGAATVHALRGIDLDIRQGEFVAISGTSGSGKSTAMNILGCLDMPTTGEYRIEGVPVQQLSADVLAALRNARIGFVFQCFNLLARTSARQNVELPLVYADVPTRVRVRRAREALTAVGLGDREDARSNQLSGGQQQRVAIARALVNDPEVILADEPTGNLDSRTSAEIMSILSALNRDRGITIVMVTHDADIAAYARRHVFFRDGRVERDRPQEAA